MKLGIIAKVINEDSFINADKKGLDFLEFCINAGTNEEEFFNQVSQIKEWMEKYDISIESIGRWKANVLDESGNINIGELNLAYRLIDAAAELKCPNYVCGCNYIESLSFYENCSRAIELFSKLIEYGKVKGVKISTYNCRKGTFVYSPETWTIIHGHLKDLGIKYDPSHARYDGGDYLKEVSEWGDRFYHVHLKGSLIVNGERVDDPPAGLDQTDWKTLLSILYAKNYTGSLSIEPHSPTWQGELGERGLEFTIDYMNSLIF